MVAQESEGREGIEAPATSSRARKFQGYPQGLLNIDRCRLLLLGIGIEFDIDLVVGSNHPRCGCTRRDLRAGHDDHQECARSHRK